jgi:ATP-dependent DNA helicase RecQ
MDDRSAIWRRPRQGELDLLYVSPEGLAAALIDRLRRLPLA